MTALVDYLSKNIKYPSEAKKSGIVGKVTVRFAVSKAGDLENFEVVKGLGHGCDKEAIRVLKESIKWNPGKKDGEPVRVSIVLPIQFALGNEEKTKE